MMTDDEIREILPKRYFDHVEPPVRLAADAAAAGVRPITVNPRVAQEIAEAVTQVVKTFDIHYSVKFAPSHTDAQVLNLIAPGEYRIDALQAFRAMPTISLAFHSTPILTVCRHFVGDVLGEHP